MQRQQINVKTRKELGANEEHLAELFANRDDGTDTFGNYGNLRCVFFFFLLLCYGADSWDVIGTDKRMRVAW